MTFDTEFSHGDEDDGQKNILRSRAFHSDSDV